jgi:hypothetical protein
LGQRWFPLTLLTPGCVVPPYPGLLKSLTPLGSFFDLNSLVLLIQKLDFNTNSSIIPRQLPLGPQFLLGRVRLIKGGKGDLIHNDFQTSFFQCAGIYLIFPTKILRQRWYRLSFFYPGLRRASLLGAIEKFDPFGVIFLKRQFLFQSES